MKKTKICAVSRKYLADIQTPVSIYLKVRDMYPESALLESSDFHSGQDSFSYIGVEPLARFTVKKGQVSGQYPDGTIDVRRLDGETRLEDALNDFIHGFEVEGAVARINGFFGYTSYDAVRYFQDITLSSETDEALILPDMTYILYRFVISVNHLSSEMTVTENIPEGRTGGMEELLSLLESRNFPSYDFRIRGEASSPVTDDDFKAMVKKGIDHCKKGDVSQIVLSRRFSQHFAGDDFKVYRMLRSINPSPYLFYFDFGSYRIFGSSPETHLKIEGDTATINPIAGTFPRTGNDEKDRELAGKLLEDPKENAEHAMLVELALDDLGRSSSSVEVTSGREIQFYSHVIHMVSRVSGKVLPDVNRIRLFADTFPAGTVSGAPKTTALELIDAIEKHPRGIYGGCIGYIGFDGNLNQAITIRTFVSRNNTLYFQAGAGVVAMSSPESELREVNNKLGALRSAMENAGLMNGQI